MFSVKAHTAEQSPMHGKDRMANAKFLVIVGRSEEM